MSHESLDRMVKYSHKMIEKIEKEVVDNFIVRKELFEFSKFQVWKVDIDGILALTKVWTEDFGVQVFGGTTENRFANGMAKGAEINDWNSVRF